MPNRLSKYLPHLLWVIALVAVLVLHFSLLGGAPAALFLNGITVNLFDPIIWLVALLPAIHIRRNLLLLPSLFIAACIVVFVKLYLSASTGSNWLVGSIIGNVMGFITVGYVINLVAVIRRGETSPSNEIGTQLLFGTRSTAMPRQSAKQVAVDPNVRCLKVYPTEGSKKVIGDLQTVGLKLSRGNPPVN